MIRGAKQKQNAKEGERTKEIKITANLEKL